MYMYIHLNRHRERENIIRLHIICNNSLTRDQVQTATDFFSLRSLGLWLMADEGGDLKAVSSSGI